MNQQDLLKKVTELKELKLMAEDLAAEISAIEDELKADMTEKDIDTFTVGAFKVSWKTVVSNRLDSKGLKANEPELYQKYLKQTSSKRFNVA